MHSAYTPNVSVCKCIMKIRNVNSIFNNIELFLNSLLFQPHRLEKVVDRS